MTSIPFGLIRMGLYGFWALCALLLFCLCCARLSYTDHTRNETSLFDGQPFYDPSIVELLISSMFALAFIPTILFLIRTRSRHPILGRAWFEIAGLSLLWLFWIGGAGAATNVWPDLSWCGDGQCHLLQAIMAFAWLGWITITALLIGSLVFLFRSRGWNDDLWETWGRASRIGEK